MSAAAFEAALACILSDAILLLSSASRAFCEGLRTLEVTLEVRSPLIALGATEVALALGLCGVCIEQPLAMAETACCSTTSVAASAPAVPFARSAAPKPTLASPRIITQGFIKELSTVERSAMAHEPLSTSVKEI